MSYATELLASKLPALLDRCTGRIPTTAAIEARLDTLIKQNEIAQKQRQQIIDELFALRLAIVSKGK